MPRKRCVAWDADGVRCPDSADYTGLCGTHAERAYMVAAGREILWPSLKPVKKRKPVEVFAPPAPNDEASKILAPLDPETCSKCGYIYVVLVGENTVKVGRSKNPAMRLTDVRAFSEKPPEMVYVSLRVFDYAAVERDVHRLLSPFRVFDGPREQFVVTPEFAITAVMAACRKRLCRHPWEKDAPKTNVQAV